MQWIDDAILLSIRKFGENKAVTRVFAARHGVFTGIARGVTGKTACGMLQPGNALHVTWKARLSEQMGTFTVESLRPFSAFAMQDKFKLAALSSACTLMEIVLPERHPYPKLYVVFYAFLELLSMSNDWQDEYVKLELAILSESGFGLDLSSCAATGRADNLVYVSPKSGRAVSEAAGKPYKDKLLPLPGFLTKASTLDGDKKETLAGLRLSGYFLEHWLAEPHGKHLPAARQRFLQLMQTEHAAQEKC